MFVLSIGAGGTNASSLAIDSPSKGNMYVLLSYWLLYLFYLFQNYSGKVCVSNIIFLAGRATSLSDFGVYYGTSTGTLHSNITGTGSPTRPLANLYSGEQKTIEKRVRLGATIEVSVDHHSTIWGAVVSKPLFGDLFLFNWLTKHYISDR